MGALTPQFLFDLESNMRVITENEYARLSQNLWWSRVAKLRPSSTRKEIVTWLLNTAMIENLGSGGHMVFEDLVTQYTEYVNEHAGIGLKMRKDQLTDTDANGMELAAEWSGHAGAQMAYWPQKNIAKAIRLGESSTGYDGQFYFSTAHPLNPYNSGAGTYANLLTSTASGVYPGACPIDASVSVDVAFNNLSKAIAYIQNIKMPNGEDPRGLTPRFLISGPELRGRTVQISNAKLIAQAAGASGGGGADVSAVAESWGLAEPVIAPELGYQTGYTHGATTYYIACEQLASSQLGALVYQEREAFNINYYTGDGGNAFVDAVLSRADELEWHVKGRNVVGYGHPYLLFQVRGS